MPPAGEGARGGRRPGWLGTTAFRVTLLHLALTLLGTAALSGVAWWATIGFASRRIATDVEQDANVLLRAARLGGIASVALSVEARVAADRTGTEYYLLAAPDGGRVAGNLAQAPRASGWSTLRLQGGPGPGSEVLAFGTRLPDGAFLVVARDLAPVRDLEARLLGAAGWVGGAALLLGLLGGVLIGRGVARRAAAMEAALAAVEAGDIGRRLPARPGGDEFDRLAGRINAALDRLQELMAAVRQVTDDVAHDLRTPLSRLRQRLEAAAAGRDADARGAVASAIEECDRILGVFEALLRIAQVEGGGRRASFQRFDLSGVVEAVAEVYGPAAEERRQTLAVRIAPGVAAWGDRELATQMLANLVENAVHHGREGGRVEVALERSPDGGATVTVADDGPGIPATERERVFRRFHRLDAARSSPGTGLGLALAKAVADLHGMGIVLLDNAPGLRVAVSVPPLPSQGEPPG
ncbi:MAG: HAMP domain-containing histidine kinase [Acetobacteraceae bacterium]|nr:HAMP domain-containing histidine kinase [Acetobacteraceae bacterium]